MRTVSGSRKTGKPTKSFCLIPQHRMLRHCNINAGASQAGVPAAFSIPQHSSLDSGSQTFYGRPGERYEVESTLCNNRIL